MTPRLDIVIVGAGLGGLACAATLLQRGHRVRVAEQAASLAEVGAGIQMSANAMKVLDRLGLRERLEPQAVRPKAFEFRRFDDAKLRLDAIIYRLIEERRRNGQDRGDLLSMLLLAQDTEGDGGQMTDAQLRDELMTIFLAGHETTANALTWTWYLLSQNPEVEAKLHREIDEVLAGRLPAFADVAQLKYTEMVLAESMRIYPPAWAIGRMALNDFEIGGYLVPKKSLVLMSQYVMHHDSRYFPEPLRFDPERWSPEARETRPQFSYFPFGGGPRRCIGEGFAWMEGILLIACLAREWQMRLAPNHPVALKPVITLRPKHGMRMIVTRRS